MQKVSTDERVNRTSAVYAMIQLKSDDEKYRPLYGRDRIRLAENISTRAMDAFPHSEVFVNYRKTHITVAVNRPINYMPNVQNINQLDQYAETLGIKIKNSYGKIRLYCAPR